MFLKLNTWRHIGPIEYQTNFDVNARNNLRPSVMIIFGATGSSSGNWRVCLLCRDILSCHYRIPVQLRRTKYVSTAPDDEHHTHSYLVSLTINDPLLT